MLLIWFRRLFLGPLTPRQTWAHTHTQSPHSAGRTPIIFGPANSNFVPASRARLVHSQNVVQIECHTRTTPYTYRRSRSMPTGSGRIRGCGSPRRAGGGQKKTRHLQLPRDTTPHPRARNIRQMGFYSFVGPTIVERRAHWGWARRTCFSQFAASPRQRAGRRRRRRLSFVR